MHDPTPGIYQLTNNDYCIYIVRCHPELNFKHTIINYKQMKITRSNQIKIATFLLLLISFYSCTTHEPSGIALPSILNNNMVLQQNSTVTIWGKSGPYVKVKINADWGQNAKTKSDETGNWKTKIKTPAAGGPYQISISSADTNIVLTNVMVGEVWLCSGQSNMEMPMGGFSRFEQITNGPEEIQKANYPEIRMFTVEKGMSEMPEENCTGNWDVCSPETAGRFSATAFFFGNKLSESFNRQIPIGLIHSSWGGTPVESWISGKYLENHKDFKETIAKINKSIPVYQEFRDWLDKHEKIEMHSLLANSEKPYMGIDFNTLQCAEENYDDNEWDSIILPKLWESTQIGNMDGTVWFRKKVTIPGSWVGKELQISLGPIDDMDVVYFNGTKIGGYEELGYYAAPRIYNIDKNLVKKGINTIAIRVIDNQGGGGIYGTENSIKLSVKDGNSTKPISLSGSWKYRVAAYYTNNTYYLFDINKDEYNEKPKIEMNLSQYTASILYNAMIAPLVPYTIKGAIWYQGEANVDRAAQYLETFPLMIKNWRDDWQIGDFPFYYVQIAPYNYSNVSGTSSADIRDAQRRTLDVTENTGMAVTLDIGNIQSIHPGNKKDVGTRLALWALSKDYGKDLTFSGPLYKSSVIEEDHIRITFNYADQGIVLKELQDNQFEIAGEDKEYIKALVKTDGNDIIVYHPDVQKPAYARYAYHNGSEASLFNKEGLPASSFTTEESLP